MKALEIAASIAVCMLPLVAPSCAPAKNNPEQTKSMMTLILPRGDSPWTGMTDSYAQEQSNKFIKAVSMEGRTNGALPSLERFNTPDLLLARNEQPKAVVVNSRYFSDLHRGDGTRIGMGQEEPLGVFLDRAFTRLKPRDLALFLLESQIIETFWHIEANLSLFREEDRPDCYQAWFRGIHTYYTNERNEKKIAFAIRIAKDTGAMTLIGGDLLDPGNAAR